MIILSPNRLHGLNSLRAFAIVIVLIHHYKVVVTKENLFGFMSVLGWAGVDLFFVLSGYLISNQLFAQVVRGDEIALGRFYARRLLRTLPNYYVVLGLYLLFPVALAAPFSQPLWSFFTFTQNIGMVPGGMFTHSWSLCVEEHFYLLFPLLAILLMRLPASLRFGWGVLVAGFILAASLRAFNWSAHGGAGITGEDYWQYIYYSTFTRFDELLPGIAIAMIKHFHPHTFANLMRFGHRIFVLGLALTGCMFTLFYHCFYIEGYGVPQLIASVGYSLLALGFALLVLAALSPACVLYRAKIPGATGIALWSYAIYLIHKPIFQFLKGWLPSHDIALNSWVAVVIVMAASIFGGWLLYFCVETPFMRLRARYLPEKAKPTQTAAATLQAS